MGDSFSQGMGEDGPQLLSSEKKRAKFSNTFFEEIRKFWSEADSGIDHSFSFVVSISWENCLLKFWWKKECLNVLLTLSSPKQEAFLVLGSCWTENQIYHIDLIMYVRKTKSH